MRDRTNNVKKAWRSRRALDPRDPRVRLRVRQRLENKHRARGEGEAQLTRFHAQWSDRNVWQMPRSRWIINPERIYVNKCIQRSTACVLKDLASKYPIGTHRYLLPSEMKDGKTTKLRWQSKTQLTTHVQSSSGLFLQRCVSTTLEMKGHLIFQVYYNAQTHTVVDHAPLSSSNSPRPPPLSFGIPG